MTIVTALTGNEAKRGGSGTTPTSSVLLVIILQSLWFRSIVVILKAESLLRKFVRQVIKIITTPMVIRYEKCTGIRLWKIGKRTAELWYISPYYSITPHRHDGEDISLVYLWGVSRFSKLECGCIISGTPSRFGQTFHIPPGTLHWFSTTNTSLIFINLGKWSKEPTSTNDNFQVS